MYRTFIKPLGLLLLMAGAGLFTSCQKDDNATDVENFTMQAVSNMEDGCGAGRAGCYELVFPITLQFGDSTTAVVGSYEEMKQTIRDWYQANMNVNPRPGHPTIVFPFQVINSAGEIITVENQEQLKALRDLCNPGGTGGSGGPGHHGGMGGPGIGHHGGGHHGGGAGVPCFKPVFPLTVAFPDSTQVLVATPKELHDAIMAWRQNNPGVPGRPQFVFPFTVELRDGTQIVVNNREELRALKDACRG